MERLVLHNKHIYLLNGIDNGTYQVFKIKGKQLLFCVSGVTWITSLDWLWHWKVFISHVMEISKASTYGGTEVTCVCLRYLSHAHKILCCAHNIKANQKTLNTYMNIVWNWLIAEMLSIFYYILMQMQIFRYQSILTMLDIDTFQPSFLFTLVNNNTSIVNTPFFSRCHLFCLKVVQ